ncbi:SUMO protease ULP1 [Aspergillus mulundensis]|uniref:Ubiquitin-like protease family profile domain-containing protein n=1 Tax=Aspergillus mulundensis TaxID=1810919 RepID=A0A3D8QIV0_9EURO|nr:hypothetical protein DSM5745_10425 [Aspergillus mulundensis]RDW61753.1 hypothetical protein DSM5745_10425 [Aspergillus mulundensis]
MSYFSNNQASPEDTVMTDASPYDALNYGPTSLQFSREDLADPARDYVPNWNPSDVKKITSDGTNHPLPTLASSSQTPTRRPIPRLGPRPPEVVRPIERSARPMGMINRPRSMLSPSQFRFSQARTAFQRDERPLVLPRANEVELYRHAATTYRTGLMNSSRPSGYSSALGAGFGRRDQPLSVHDPTRQAALIKPRKRDQEGNILDHTGSLFAPRARSADDNTRNDESRLMTTDAGSPIAKFRRVSGEASNTSSMSIDNSETSIEDPAQPIAQRTSFDSPAVPLNTVAPVTPVEQTVNSNGIVPGCWPSASTPGSAAGPSEPQQPTQPQRFPQPQLLRAPHFSPQHQPQPVTETHVTPQAALMSGALMPGHYDSPQGQDASDVAPEVARPVDNGPPVWAHYYATVHGTLRQAYTAQRAMMQTVANAFHGALAAACTLTRQTHQAAGTAAQRVTAMWRERRDAHARARAARAARAAAAPAPDTATPPVSPARASPPRVNIATLSPEQQENVRRNIWRRRHGFPVNENLPFPDEASREASRMAAAFYDPRINAIPSFLSQGDPSRRVDDVSRSTSRTHRGLPPTPVNDRDRPQAPRNGILKRSLVPTMSPETQRRLLPGPITPQAHRVGLEHRVQFRSPIVQSSPSNVHDWARASAQPGPGLDALLVDQLNGPDAQLQAQLAASLDPYVDPWGQRDFAEGTPRSAIKLVKPASEPVPSGRSESVYAKELQKIEKEKRLKDGPVGRQIPEGVVVRPLADDWKARLEKAMKKPDYAEVAHTHTGEPLTRGDIATCYTPLKWLNDEVINSYLGLIVEHMREEHHNAGRHAKPHYHAFNTFFFSNLRDKGYDSVRRWAKRAKIGGPDLLDVDTVFIPVHDMSHWTLIVVKPSARTIEHFDSLGSLSKRHVATVKDWLRGELGDLFVDAEWNVLPSKSPQQNNGSDCGVFLLTTAKAVALNIEPLAYGAKDTPLLRQKIVAELMNGRFEAASL